MTNELRCDKCGHVHGNGTYCNEVAGETEDEVIIYCDCKFTQVLDGTACHIIECLCWKYEPTESATGGE